MTILISIFGFAGRIAGDLLTSALGWAGSLLFGRVPRSHQIFVLLMMAGSFTWLLVDPRPAAARTQEPRPGHPRAGQWS